MGRRRILVLALTLGFGSCSLQRVDVADSARPQLGVEAAMQHRVADYLAQGPTPWQPADVEASHWRADFTVAADGSGTHRSVQAAVDAVPSLAAPRQAGRRWFIHIQPGTYRGPLCIRNKPPLALYGTPEEARAAVLVDSRYNALPKRPGIDAAQPCHPNLAAATHGTSGSATAIVASADVWLAHLRIVNDALESAGAGALASGAQAVALMTQADRIQLEDVQLLSYQDTFYVKRPAPDQPARVFVRGSVIHGDVDFVFGNATLVIDDSTLVSRAGRLPPGRGGPVLAPSTPAGAGLGFLVQRSRWVAEPGVALEVTPGSSSLGRAWDEGVPPGQWVAGRSPNGQALVRDSALGPHITAWTDSTSRRAFRAPLMSNVGLYGEANRLFEFRNRALPADAAREVLADHDGWASANGGTRGGAQALPEDVHVVRDRASLLAALQPHERPRIVKLVGRIDLSVDAQGHPLGAEAFRHPAFNWPAFAAAYDPGTWGRRPPEGPLEAARKASARAQATHVLVSVPSRTTLIGIGSGAHLVHGGLVLDGVRDVIIRNLHFRDAHDHFPAWDPQDNAQGEWNAEYDNLTLRGARHVWIDHCSFDDGDRPDAAEPMLLGRPMQRHDGLLDITRASDHITVSWNHFRQHGKTSLVGGSDRHADDEGRLRVSFHHNLWEQTRERSPRVRFGRVHVANNLYRVTAANEFAYSIGVGHRASILSQHNVWEVPADVSPQRLVRRLGQGALRDAGSLLNGQPLDLAALLAASGRAGSAGSTSAVPAVDWTPPMASPPDPAAQVAARVRAGAGAGRLWTGIPR